MNVLELDGAGRMFGPDAGLRHADLALPAGRIHALVGLNGAGKTTLMRLALGMVRPDRGMVRVLGTDLRRADPALWARVGHLVEHPLAYGELTVRANLMVAGRLHGLDRASARAAVETAITDLHLERYAAVPARALSLGNLQRLGLAAAVLHHPGLLILDEPTNGLDPSGVLLLREHLMRLRAAGCGVLVSSHHLDEVARVADRITVVNDGRLVGELDPEGIDIERAFFRLVHDDDTAHRRAAS